MSERTRRRVMAFAKKQPEDPIADDRYLQSLVESMPRRLQEVIEREGDTTKY